MKSEPILTQHLPLKLFVRTESAHEASLIHIDVNTMNIPTVEKICMEMMDGDRNQTNHGGLPHGMSRLGNMRQQAVE